MHILHLHHFLHVVVLYYIFLMHSHPFSPQHEPPESPSIFYTPSHSRLATPSPLTRGFSLTMMTPTQIQTQTQTPEFHYQRFPDRLLLRNHRTTDPRIWCCAIICLILSILLISSVLTILTIFLVVKPKHPEFDTNHATLNAIYFDSPGNFNGDFTFLANFSNPNRKLHVKFESAVLELFFDNNMIAKQSIKPFSQRQKETGVVKIHFISSLVYLPLSHAMELQRQVLSNKVMYTVKGNFKVRVSFGWIHFTYHLHSHCELQMSSPPSGSLMARSCKTETKR